MSYMLGHLHNGWQVDQAILSEEDRVVVSSFYRDWVCDKNVAFTLRFDCVGRARETNKNPIS
jgi:hypothetical protein